MTNKASIKSNELVDIFQARLGWNKARVKFFVSFIFCGLVPQMGCGSLMPCTQRAAASRSAGFTCFFFSFPLTFKGLVNANLLNLPALSADSLLCGVYYSKSMIILRFSLIFSEISKGVPPTFFINLLLSIARI